MDEAKVNEKATHLATELINLVKSKGERVLKTRELVDVSMVAHFNASDQGEETIRQMESPDFAIALCDVIKGNKDHKFYNMGPYFIKDYTDIYKQIRELVSLFETGWELSSRQFVVSFPAHHCFLSMNFLFRQGKLLNIVTMRSCNVVSNLETDIYIAYDAAKYFMEKLMRHSILMEQRDIIVKMQIASLHILEKDLNDVV